MRKMRPFFIQFETIAPGPMSAPEWLWVTRHEYTTTQLSRQQTSS